MEQELASIKKANETEQISKEEFEFRIREIAKCKRDIVYFAEKYFRVINLDKGLHIIKLYDVQKDFLRFLVDNNKVVCVSGRQQGKSTIYCIYSLWLATFFPEKKIMILANKLTTALELLGRIQMGYSYLPKWLKSGQVVVNKGELTFANRSSIRAFASSSDAARGFAANVCILDEFAFLQKSLADKLFTSMYPVISSSKDGHFIIVSTPNGTDNLYYDIWQQANSKDQSKNLEGWKPFEMFWWQVPGHDEEWKKRQIAAIGEQRFAQEFNNEFLTSTQTRKLIPDDIIEKYMIKLSEYKAADIQPKIQKIVSEDATELFEFKMWHEFDQRKTYLASADISEGIGGDSSVLYIWDVTDLSNIKMCAKFSSSTISLVQFAYVTRKILALYGDPWLAAERNGVSAGTLDALRITYGFSKIASENKKNEPGIYSHVTIKGAACLWAREMMTTDGFGFTLYDKDLVDEFRIFVKKDTKGVHNVYQALPGTTSHDDHIMAFIWGLYLLQKDLIDKYFIVCTTFNSVLGMQYPRLLQPLEAYTNDQLSKISKDPIYIDFMEFKNSLVEKMKKARIYEEQQEAADIFNFKKQKDIYFDDDYGSDDWRNVPADWNLRKRNDCIVQPVYFNQTSRAPIFFVN